MLTLRQLMLNGRAGQWPANPPAMARPDPGRPS